MVLVVQLEPLPAPEGRATRAGCPRPRRRSPRARSGRASPCRAGSACRAARRAPSATGCPAPSRRAYRARPALGAPSRGRSRARRRARRAREDRALQARLEAAHHGRLVEALLHPIDDQACEASADVAAGEGALRTCSARSVSETTKSSTSVPSRARACARTPLKPGSKSSGSSSRTYSAASRGQAPRAHRVAQLAQPGAPPARAPSAGAGPERASTGPRGASSALGPRDTLPSMCRLRCTPRNGSAGFGTG